MSKEVICSKQAPEPIGPYSQAIKIGKTVYTSGQIPINPSTNSVKGETVEEQTECVLENLKAVLEAAGSGLARVIKTTVFLKDMSQFAAMNGVYAKYFSGGQPPARSTVEVARLPKDVLVEIEAVACVE